MPQYTLRHIQHVVDWDVTIDVTLDRDTKEAKPGLLSMALLFEETHLYGS